MAYNSGVLAENRFDFFHAIETAVWKLHKNAPLDSIDRQQINFCLPVHDAALDSETQLARLL
jgi:hypothetical protein